MLDTVIELCVPGEHILVLAPPAALEELEGWINVPVDLDYGGTEDMAIYNLNSLRESLTPTICIRRGVPAFAGIRWRAIVLVSEAPTWELDAALGQMLRSNVEAAHLDIIGIRFNPAPLVGPLLKAARIRQNK